MSGKPRAGALWACLVALLLAAPWWGEGCRRAGVPVSDPGPREEALQGVGQRLLQEAGLSEWKAEDAADVGVGLEGLYRLVNGAADSYWERGVTGAVFQDFRSEQGGEFLEVQHYVFRGAARAGAFFEQECTAEGGAVTLAGRSSHCLFAGDPASRALVWRDQDVIDLRLYGSPGSDPIAGLVQAFEHLPPSPAAGE